jgi:hypothetical protein
MNPDPTQPPLSPNPDDRRAWQLRITVILLVAYGAFATAMLWMADVDADVWQKRVYIYTGIQAIVFTAVGWLFGREVNLSAATAATAEAKQARSETRAVQQHAAGLRDELTVAKEVAAREHSKGVAARAAVDALASTKASYLPPAGSRDMPMAAGPADEITAMKKMLDSIYGY